MSDYTSLLRDLFCELLQKWPLSLFWLWFVPLFFAVTSFHLAKLGLRGRGLPLTTGRWRLKGWPSKIGSAVLIIFGLLICIAFAYWLGVALYRQFT